MDVCVYKSKDISSSGNIGILTEHEQHKLRKTQFRGDINSKFLELRQMKDEIPDAKRFYEMDSYLMVKPLSWCRNLGQNGRMNTSTQIPSFH